VLPPELIRKGRFDEVFFVDLPTQSVREKILSVHLRRREVAADSIDVQQIATLSKGFSGAELEQLIVSALYHTYADEQTVTTELLIKLANDTKPLSVLMAEKINVIRNWASGRAVPVSL